MSLHRKSPLRDVGYAHPGAEARMSGGPIQVEAAEVALNSAVGLTKLTRAS